jgi:hypothetical protein
MIAALRMLLTDQRGVALPLAMLALVILSALIIGFSVLSASEPTIANNQLMVAQARSLAEAGIERAIWALNNPTDPNGLPASTPLPVSWTGSAPYDGSQLIVVSTGAVNVGGFRVTVTRDTTPGLTVPQLVISSVGWVPNDTTTNPKAHQKVVVTVANPQFFFRDPPAALSVRGELQAGGNSTVDSRADTSCGAKSGTLTTGATSMNGNASDIWGADGNDTRNQFFDAANGSVPTSASDIVQNVSTSSFDNYIWSDSDINALRLYAKAHGTYLQGSVTFDSGNQIPNGVVFVDTVDGTNITQEGVTPPTPPSNFGTAAIHGNAAADASRIFKGILFVNGTLAIDGSFKMYGFAYAQNDISYHGVGTGGVWGAMMSRNIRDTSSTSIDSDLLGQSLINYNCAYARNGGGALLSKWSVVKGTYREKCDSCA